MTGRISRGYLILLGGAALYYLFRWPVTAGDTDLWYHLNAGRYILQKGAIPNDCFFSFLSPCSPWLDYYWLFQALVYSIYSPWGYYGILVFRTVLLLGTWGLVCRFLLRKPGSGSVLYLTALCGLYLGLLLPRFLLVRPHMFIYLFIVVFLYVLEFHPRRAYLLVPSAILWCNFHGAAYPILLVLLGAYLAEHFFRRLRGTADPVGESKGRSPAASSGTPGRREDLWFLAPSVAAMACVYVTPHGAGLLDVPFMSLRFVSQSISEYTPLRAEDLLSLEVTGLVPAHLTLFNLLVAGTVLALATVVWERRVRVSHLLLLGAGTYLLAQGARFAVEFGLLALPLLKAGVVESSRAVAGGRTGTRLLAWSLAGLVMILPLTFLRDTLSRRTRYPFSRRALPHGVATFLNSVEAGGSVLNSPNKGGYLQWMLDPRYKIFTDMQLAYHFNDEQYYLSTAAFTDKSVLGRLLRLHDPSFITAPIDLRSFREIVREFPDYVLVFFDDSEVLYVHRGHFPGLARNHAVRSLDPYELSRQVGEPEIPLPDSASIRRELSRLIAADPGSGLTRHYASRLHRQRGEHALAALHADSIVANYPELPDGYSLKGEALAGLGKLEEAATWYGRALPRSAGGLRRLLHRKLGALYLALGRPGKAYGSFRRGVAPFSPQTAHQDLYDYGTAARLAGRRSEARALLGFLYAHRLTSRDRDLARRLKSDLTDLGVRFDEGSLDDRGLASILETRARAP